MTDCLNITQKVKFGEQVPPTHKHRCRKFHFE